MTNLPPYHAERAAHFQRQAIEREAAERQTRIANAREIVARVEGQLVDAQAELAAAIEADAPEVVEDGPGD